MSSKRFRLGMFVISGVLLCAVGGYLAVSWPHLAEEGSEVTPARYPAIQRRWAAKGPYHYRLLASYHYDIVGGCPDDVEVMNERVIRTYRTDCGSPGFLTVSKIYDMFQDFVGQESTRPLASDRCNYYYVNANFDRATGYPRYLKSQLISAPTRGQYFSLERSSSVQSCLAIGPPRLTATIQSLTPLD